MYVFINIPRAYSKFNWPGECYISDWSWTAMWPLTKDIDDIITKFWLLFEPTSILGYYSKFHFNI